MEMELAQQNKIQASIRQETLVLKKNANQLKDEIDTLSITLRELQAEQRQFSAKVVHSPERIKLALAEANRKLEGVKKIIVENDNNRKSLQMDIERLVEHDKSVQDTIQTIDWSDERVQKFEMVEKDREGVENQLELAEGSLDEMRKQLKEHSKQVDVAGEKFFIPIPSFLVCTLLVNNQTSPFAVSNKTDVTTNLKKELEEADRDQNEAFERLGLVEGEMVDRIARIEAKQKRVDELETSIEEEKIMGQEWIATKKESFHKFERLYEEKEMSFFRLLFG